MQYILCFSFIMLTEKESFAYNDSDLASNIHFVASYMSALLLSLHFQLVLNIISFISYLSCKSCSY